MKSNANVSSSKALVFASLLISLSVVFGYVTTIYFTPSFRISLANVPIIFSGMVLGPFYGFGVGAISDVLNFILKPAGPYHFGFTFTNGMFGFIPGIIFLYFRKINVKELFSLKNITICVAITEIIGSVLLYTYFLASMYGTGFLLMLPVRVFKGLVMIIVQVIIIYFLLKTFKRYI